MAKKFLSEKILFIFSVKKIYKKNEKTKKFFFFLFEETKGLLYIENYEFFILKFILLIQYYGIIILNNFEWILLMLCVG